MKKQPVFLSLLLLLLATSCSNSDSDCPGKTYYSEISLGNHTDFNVDVMLYPKSVNGVDLYLASDMGGQHLETHFTMEPQQVSTDGYKYVIYSYSDSSVSPSHLLNLKFDSIQFTILDKDSSKILITPDTAINTTNNPFIEDSAWASQIINSSMPTNDCPNLVEIKSHQYNIESVDK